MKGFIRTCYRHIILALFHAKNRITSNDVSLKSLQGIGIEVREQSTIDSMSIIGSYSYIGKNCSITKSSIGCYCSIANNVSIGQGDHLLNEISTSSVFYKDSYETLTAKSCRIEHDVWIGVDSIILRGVHIGVGAVIGANSVVTKDVPPFAVVVGSPAKIIKYRFSESKRKSILESQWWLKEPEEAKILFAEMNK